VICLQVSDEVLDMSSEKTVAVKGTVEQVLAAAGIIIAQVCMYMCV